MNTLLSILVPHHREKSEVVKPLLDSLALQQGCDLSRIEVVIANDGGHTVDVGDYPFPIKQVSQEQAGVSAARNLAFDNSSGEYVMFCDFDDMFHNMMGVFYILKEIDKGFDFFLSAFVEEAALPTGRLGFVLHEYDEVFIHGKVFRRSFLVDNDLRWDPALTLHEDHYFNFLCKAVSKTGRYCPTPFYLWKYRSDSVARKDPKFLLRTCDELMRSSRALVEQLLDRGYKGEAMRVFLDMVFEQYHIFNTWEGDLELKREKYPAFREYFEAHRDIWDDCPEDIREQYREACYKRMFVDQEPKLQKPLAEWLEGTPY